MRPEVQVLPGPQPALTSGDASQRCWSPLERAYTGPRTLTWLPFLVIDVLLPASHRPVCVPPSSEKRPEWTLDDPVGRLRQPDPCWALTRRAIGSAIVEEAPTVVPSGRWPHPDVP